MRRPYTEEYRGYTLRCAPQATEDGRFLAFCIISHGSSPVQVDRAGVLDLPSFADEETAAMASWSASTRWLEDGIGMQPSAPQVTRSAGAGVQVRHLLPKVHAARTGVLHAVAPGAG